MNQTEKTMKAAREELVEDALKSLSKLRELALTVEECLTTTGSFPLYFDDLLAYFNSLSTLRGAVNGLDLVQERNKRGRR